MINNWSEGANSLFTLGWVVTDIVGIITFRDIAKFNLYVTRTLNFNQKI